VDCSGTRTLPLVAACLDKIISSNNLLSPEAVRALHSIVSDICSCEAVFGTANITQPAQPGTGLFGGGGAFGTNNATNAQPAANNGAFGAGGLFGQKPAAPGGGLFGSTNTATAGTQPAAGGLFGGGGAFGQTNTAATNNTFSGGGSLFGQKPATNGFGTQAAAPAAGNSLFGGGNTSTLNVSALGGGGATAPGPSLTASIAQPIGANLPIFDLLPPGPRSIPLDPPKKKSTLFQDIPTRQPVPRLQLGYVPQGSRLRGFAAPPAASVAGGLAFSSNTRGALAMSTTTAPIGTEAFFGGGTATAALGSGARQSVKKLVLDKKVEPADLFASLGGRAAPGSLKKGAPAAKPAFNAALGIAAREREAADAARGATPSPAPAPKKNAGTVFAGTSDGTSDGEAAREGETADGYWVRPPLAALKALGYERLAALPDLVVGRSGRGEIAFLEPVNLTEVPRLTDLLGGLIEFGEQDCSLYPGYDDADRPPPGQGLNVRARITILGAWPRDRASKAAIKDDKDPLAVKHLKRLKNMKGTHFESYEISEGKWIFTVDHI
jgi:nuclear pore complex protein Nup98-Nup96